MRVACIRLMTFSILSPFIISLTIAMESEVAAPLPTAWTQRQESSGMIELQNAIPTLEII
jgi:hypothetical protein